MNVFNYTKKKNDFTFKLKLIMVCKVSTFIQDTHSLHIIWMHTMVMVVTTLLPDNLMSDEHEIKINGKMAIQLKKKNRIVTPEREGAIRCKKKLNLNILFLPVSLLVELQLLFTAHSVNRLSVCEMDELTFHICRHFI